MNTKKTVIVTGAAGYIGGQTVLALKDQGHTVVALDQTDLPVHLQKVADHVEVCDYGSKRATQAIDAALPDAVVHCAGTSLVGPSMLDPSRYYQNNFVKTKALLDFLVYRNRPVRFVFSSSAAVYGDPQGEICTEQTPTCPISPYGESKLMTEMMLNSYRYADNLDYVAFRYFNVAGADGKRRHGQTASATHIVARVLESIHSGSQFVLNGNKYNTPDGTCIRDYVHVEDIASAHLIAIDKEAVPSGVYNLSQNVGVSNLEVVRTAQAVTGKSLKYTVGETRPGDPKMLVASADLFAKTCGWKPQRNIEKIIEDAWHWHNR